MAALLTALLLQVGANLANDVFDYNRGADNAQRLGPVRVTSAGLLRPREVLVGMWVVFGIAILLGIYLTVVAGWPVVLIGLAAILGAIAYTGGPFPFGYYGLGDLFVFIFFGPVAVVGTYYVQAMGVSLGAVWASVPMGLLTVAILVVNNLRDIETDRRAGKRTLAVRLGVKGTRIEYLLCLVGAYLCLLLMWVTGALPLGVLLAWLSIPRAVGMARMIYTQSGRPLNIALAGTGQLELLFALLFAIGLVLMKALL
jgi:1,4-dihydroxy-2-naphthoate octaprenyltransferase